jgi:hypothetical protein
MTTGNLTIPAVISGLCSRSSNAMTATTTAPAKQAADVTKIRRALSVLFMPGDVVELRILDVQTSERHSIFLMKQPARKRLAASQFLKGALYAQNYSIGTLR